MLRGKQKFKMESIFFEREKRREMVKNLGDRGIKNRTMVKFYWKILEYNTVILKDNTGSLKAQQGKNMAWDDKEVVLVIFWKQTGKIEKNGMKKMENVIWLKGNWCMGGLYVKTRKGIHGNKLTYLLLYHNLNFI